MASELHDGLPEVLNLDNMANGAVYEMVGEALKKMAQNIADVNTDSEQKRRITLIVTATPYKDRSGAELAIKVEAKLAGMRSIDSTMYIARKDGEYLAFGRNTKQEEIQFGMNETPDAASKAKAN